MGRVAHSRRKTKHKLQYKKSHKTANRSRDTDQKQDDLEMEAESGEKKHFEEDEDLAGLGQFYCTPCARHFMDESTLNIHLKTKVHKRR